MPKAKLINYDELKIAVNKKGYNWGMIAEVLGRSPQHVISIAKQRSKNIVTAKAIQKAADIPFESIFKLTPSEYEALCVDRFSIPAEDKAARRAQLVQAIGA